MQQAVLHSQENQAVGSVKGSSFYAAMRLMPPAQRAAMYAVYHFCRAVDDIADDKENCLEDRIAVLQRWRQHIGLLYAGDTVPDLQGLAESISAFGLRQDDFLAVIDGVEMDVCGLMQAPSEATLALYCDRVACAVGRLSVRIFGLPERDGVDLAHHLGMALQLTNILRDLDEDSEMGRLYLPRELLDEAGIKSSVPAEALADPAIAEACIRVAARAGAHFYKANGIIDQFEPELVRTPLLMSHTYRAIHSALLDRGFSHPRRKVTMSKTELGITLAKIMFF